MMILSLKTSVRNTRGKNTSGFGDSSLGKDSLGYPMRSLSGKWQVETTGSWEPCSTTGNGKRWLEALAQHTFQYLPVNHTYHLLLSLPIHLNSSFTQPASIPSVLSFPLETLRAPDQELQLYCQNKGITARCPTHSPKLNSHSRPECY